MRKWIFLDAGPLGLATKPVRTPEVRAINLWLDDLLAADHRVFVPAIADYEVRRELERAGKARGLARLDAFNAADADRYLPLSDAALRLGARLWARARNQGTPTGDPRELDCDVLIAAQALTLNVPPGELVIATTNVGHLAQFVAAALWRDIAP